MKVEQPSPLLPPHPCWSQQPTPGSALPHHPKESSTWLLTSRWVPSKAPRGDREATDRLLHAKPAVGREEKRKAALAKAHADSGMVHVQAALLVKGLHENQHVSTKQGRGAARVSLPTSSSAHSRSPRSEDFYLFIHLFIYIFSLVCFRLVHTSLSLLLPFVEFSHSSSYKTLACKVLML